MREPVGGADNERIKGVATVKAGYASGSGIGIVRALGEVTWPTVLVIARAAALSSISSLSVVVSGDVVAGFSEGGTVVSSASSVAGGAMRTPSWI